MKLSNYIINEFYIIVTCNAARHLTIREKLRYKAIIVDAIRQFLNNMCHDTFVNKL